MISFDNIGMVENAVKDCPIPRFVKIKQNFSAVYVDDIEAEIRKQMSENKLFETLKPKQRVAIAVGSRQIDRLAVIIGTLVKIVRECGGEPYLFPSMGSHGGATAQGQTEILAEYGITEQTMGAPIDGSMEVTQVGEIEGRIPVYVASHLLTADAVINVNRIKTHPGFSGPIESGLVKMSVIGFGKQRGAQAIHSAGRENRSERLTSASKIVQQNVKVAFGVGIIENAYDKLAEIHCIPAAEIYEKEPPLLLRSKSYMPRIIPNPLDVLVVDEIGKNISGMGADPNITCRATSPQKEAPYTAPTRMIFRDLTPQTLHAASGMGQADIITRRLFDQIDAGKTYVNQITSAFLDNSKIPLVLPNDRCALQAAIKTSLCPDLSKARVARIKNTLELSEIYVSEALIPELRENPQVEILSEPFELRFDDEGYIVD